MPAGFLTPRRLTIGVLCVLSLIGSVGLAWWQWDRFESASGTFQNLGYVLQWPLFGLFPAFMVLRIRKLRREAADKAETADSEPDRAPVVEVPKPRPVSRPGVEDQDDELVAYNRYLAELYERDQQER
ncbi:hypothetical protein [Amycolatopsis alkalitolerans]|uniref:Uncharacterized protein n=1 Tax=Amycolatopsis alkalitolerans TaxID=2547244 RepID=A0A5C4M801_9PSEU|nr:hypothetical protein [Amycolatopsis alkalitolerans]TNC29013.1 hypothetical protein FG385_02565 [Amycolatopsis alkalitolerans]